MQRKEVTEIDTPKHYDNSKGSLYKIALERGWNPYLFDIVKRLERAEKKGCFEEDLKKSKDLIDLYEIEKEKTWEDVVNNKK